MTEDRDTSAHARHSVLREIILEHDFIAALLRHLWREGVHDAEILRSEFDAGGYDLVLTRGALTRHIQLKALRREGRRRDFAISERLAERPSGCVLCIVVTDDLAVDHYRWFGAAPDSPLPIIDGFPLARHTKGDATGYKAERAGQRRVPLSRFERLDRFGDVVDRLLGPRAEAEHRISGDGPALLR